MARKLPTIPVILPARMSLLPSAFSDLNVAILDLPYQRAIKDFMRGLGTVVGRLQPWHHPSYRLLNNAIAACSPTIVHGFESYGRYPNKTHRMLAVGRKDGEPALRCPSEDKLAQLIRVWIHHWGQSYALKKHIEGKAKDIWETLEHEVDRKPNTQWRRVSPAILIGDLYEEDGLAFQAIPSLLSTLLHGQTSVIGEEKREIRWRRSQNDDKRLCVVSDPLYISFEKKKPKSSEVEVKEGFFTYKLEFRVQTQTGREKPWIYTFLRCQRYASRTLRSNKRGNDITILAGVNQSRVQDWERDTTLVRLRARKYTSEKYANWTETLPRILGDMNARALVNPYDIYQNPQAFWHTTNGESSNRSPDEYYIPHVEGYRYPNNGNHPVATGFGLMERSEVIDLTCCNLLSNALEHGGPLTPDTAIFHPNKLPICLQTFGDIAEPPKILNEAQAEKKGVGTSKEERKRYKAEMNALQRTEKRPIILDAITKATREKPLCILLIYRNENTKEAAYQQLREALLLNESDDLPTNITIKECVVLDENLLSPLDPDEHSPVERNKQKQHQSPGFEKKWEKQIRRSHHQRMKDWRLFLKNSKSATNEDTKHVALVELFDEESYKPEAFHESQSPKGAIREACAREQILSQMVLPVSTKLEDIKTLKGKDKGRLQNTVQDLVSRQLGVLYGGLEDVYQSIGLSERISTTLDVIAFCIAETKLDVEYCCAIRLRASREIDVLLPGNDDWIPYSEAGWHIGQVFAEGRKSTKSRKSKSNQQEAENRNPIRRSRTELIDFVEKTLTTQLERPTIALIKAAKWRDRSKGSNGWSQLTVGGLERNISNLYFNQDKKGTGRTYKQGDESINNLLCVIRIRTGDETPQYITNRTGWSEDSATKDLYQLSGFVEYTEKEIFHYFSIGRLPKTIKGKQSTKSAKDPYKSEDGGAIAFKHQQMVEMVPFCIHLDFQDEKELTALCRVPHYLRFTPGWSMGNIVLPYPMHLGDQLIRDQLCILPDG